MNKPEPEWDTKYSILLNRVNEQTNAFAAPRSLDTSNLTRER